jgi:hypothetical protein
VRVTQAIQAGDYREPHRGEWTGTNRLFSEESTLTLRVTTWDEKGRRLRAGRPRYQRSRRDPDCIGAGSLRSL